MPKVRKTREQKEKTALRREEARITYSLSDISTVKTTPSITPIKTSINHSLYGYVVTDVRKTFLLSLMIIIAQYLLFLALTHHIVKIPGISY